MFIMVSSGYSQSSLHKCLYRIRLLWKLNYLFFWGAFRRSEWPCCKKYHTNFNNADCLNRIKSCISTQEWNIQWLNSCIIKHLPAVGYTIPTIHTVASNAIQFNWYNEWVFPPWLIYKLMKSAPIFRINITETIKEGLKEQIEECTMVFLQWFTNQTLMTMRTLSNNLPSDMNTAEIWLFCWIYLISVTSLWSWWVLIESSSKSGPHPLRGMSSFDGT